MSRPMGLGVVKSIGVPGHGSHLAGWNKGIVGGGRKREAPSQRVWSSTDPALSPSRFQRGVVCEVYHSWLVGLGFEGESEAAVV